MESSTSSDLLAQQPWLGWAAIGAAALATVILLWFLWKRPLLVRSTKLLLLLGIGILPAGAALLGDVAGYEQTKARSFCGSCHVMVPYTRDAANGASASLAALHSRNEFFGDQSCYTCHADYVMFGTLVTKLGGLRHVWEYVTEFRDVPAREAVDRIELYRPYPNANCIHCHSTTLPGWLEVDEHEGLGAGLRRGTVGCVSEGCHGDVHDVGKRRRRPAVPPKAGPS